MVTVAVYLTIRSASKTADELTRQLGLIPDRSRTRGERMRPGQTPFKESVWSLKSPAADEATLETQTDALLAVLVPLTSEFQQLISDCTIELDCRIEIEKSRTEERVIRSRG